MYVHSSGVLWARGRLLAGLLVYLFIVIFICSVWILTGWGIIGHLIWRANVIYCTQLLGQCRQVLKVRRWKVKPGSKLILSHRFLVFSLCWIFLSVLHLSLKLRSRLRFSGKHPLKKVKQETESCRRGRVVIEVRQPIRSQRESSKARGEARKEMTALSDGVQLMLFKLL